MNFLLAFSSSPASPASPTRCERAHRLRRSRSRPPRRSACRAAPQTGTDSQTATRSTTTSGDAIVAIDGQQFPTFDHVDRPTPPLAYLRAHAGQQVTLTVQHADGTSRDVPVTLRVADRAAHGRAGRRSSSRELVHGQHPAHDLLDGDRARLRSARVDAATLILRGLGDLVGNLTNPPVSGPGRHRRRDRPGAHVAAAGLPDLVHRPAVGQPGGRQRAAVPAARRRARRRVAHPGRDRQPHRRRPPSGSST